VENGRLEASTTSNGGSVSVVAVVLVGELWRMTNGGRRRCSVHRTILGTHFILLGWCTASNRGMGLISNNCDSMARYSSEEPK
jgi:hypothetical protein